MIEVVGDSSDVFGLYATTLEEETCLDIAVQTASETAKTSEVFNKTFSKSLSCC